MSILRSTIACVTLMLLAFTFFTGCANDAASKNGDEPWSREVIIEFRTDTSEFERNQFYSINYLEFMSQYDSDTVRARIISGESIADLIDRLSTDPKIISIKPAD